MFTVRLSKNPKPFGSDNGLLHEVAVTGRKVGADEWFYTQLASNEDLFRKVVDLVKTNYPQPWTTLSEAVKILGENRVITPTIAAGIYKEERSAALPVVPYSPATLKSCMSGLRLQSWFLVWHTGRSIREIWDAQWKLYGVPSGNADYENRWWLYEANEDEWANRRYPAGFYLINLQFYRRYEGWMEKGFATASLTWQQQEELIARKWRNCERAPDPIYIEAKWMVRETFQCRDLLHDHWGTSKASNGSHLQIIDTQPLMLWSQHADDDTVGDHTAAILMKPDVELVFEPLSA